MLLFISLFAIISLIQFIQPNKFSNAPEGSEDKILEEHSWHQFALLGITFVVGLVRGWIAIGAPDVPQRLPNMKRPMYFVIGYGVFQAILGISLTFLHSPDSETRYLITTVSQVLLAVLLGYFAFPYLFTCTIYYTWIFFPTFLCTMFFIMPLVKYQECYYSQYICWVLMIFVGLLELYLMAVNQIYDGYHHSQRPPPRPFYS
ncbi:hypothetical protein GCK72_016103 [Caenorhabditis remanei]|uniref:Uncharacterized protein n=1 Tax=Caenorhabditis remanei TaxID=31234 RepID=A0A6A5GYI4_CAERE|nr:hypothetical protein GCK72_016103 [Caenorhabditis remanei]KAF1759636.1 hypothetical protein GCK72_016103 [Caenorhabditis remanei]